MVILVGTDGGRVAKHIYIYIQAVVMLIRR